MSRDVIARVLGHAMVDQGFADQLHKDPKNAAASLGVHLNADQVGALKKIDLGQVRTIGDTIRNKLGAQAFLDQNIQQQQARMD